MDLPRRELDVFYVATRAALLFLVPLFISDLPLYLQYARNLIPGGRFPYAHFDFEYPPLAYPLMAIPAWLHDLLGLRDDQSYRTLFGLTLLPFDFLLFRGFLRKPPFAGAALAYLLLTGAMGLLLFDRFDLAVGFLIAWPFLGAATDARFAWSWGLGGALKLVPLLLAPARLLDDGAFSRPRLVRFGAVVGAPLAVACAGAFLAAHGKISFLSHHAGRGVQIESLLGSLVMAARAFFGFRGGEVEWNFGAQHLAPVPGMVAASRALFGGSLAFTYAGLWAFPRRRDSLVGAWLLILAFVAFGYVLSPQFLLWLIPLALCAAGRVPAGWRRGLWLGLFGLAVAATGLHFRHYWDYVNLAPASVLLVLVRNGCLVLSWCLSWAWMQADQNPVEA